MKNFENFCESWFPLIPQCSPPKYSLLSYSTVQSSSLISKYSPPSYSKVHSPRLPTSTCARADEYTGWLRWHTSILVYIQIQIQMQIRTDQDEFNFKVDVFNVVFDLQVNSSQISAIINISCVCIRGILLQFGVL